MMQTKNEMLESRTEAVSRDALVRACLLYTSRCV